MSKPFSIKARIRSFKYAFQGLWFLIREEHNFRIHLGTASTVIFLGIYFHVSRPDWRWLVASIGMVMVAEAFNSAIERLVDLKQPEHDPKAKIIKDLAAVAVLLSALTALVIGIIIFWPYVQAQF